MSRPYWDEQLETLPVERRQILRDHRLRWQVRRCFDGSPFYRARLEAAGITPGTFNGLADLDRLPILRPADLPSDPSPEEAQASWAVSPPAWRRQTEWIDEGVSRVLTDGDLVHRADLAARALWAAGARPNGTVKLQHEPYSALVPGLKRIGAKAEQESASKYVVAPLWPYVNSVALYSCEADDGLHWSDDHFLIEIYTIEACDRDENGQTGPVLLTDLTREGSPIVRFWTGITADLIDEPCACGRTSVRSRHVGALT